MEKVWWCGGALLVTLLVIYLEFEAHLTSMATTAFCSNKPSHLGCTSWDDHLFSTGQWPNTPPGCVRAILPKRSVLHQMTWPPQSPDLNPINMVRDELDCRVKEKRSKSAQHMWELLQDYWKSIPGEAGWENAKSVQSYHQDKRWLFEESQISNIFWFVLVTTLFWLLHDSICVIS
jgi:hypothetical protein